MSGSQFVFSSDDEDDVDSTNPTYDIAGTDAVNQAYVSLTGSSRYPIAKPAPPPDEEDKPMDEDPSPANAADDDFDIEIEEDDPFNTVSEIFLQVAAAAERAAQEERARTLKAHTDYLRYTHEDHIRETAPPDKDGLEVRSMPPPMKLLYLWLFTPDDNGQITAPRIIVAETVDFKWLTSMLRPLKTDQPASTLSLQDCCFAVLQHALLLPKMSDEELQACLVHLWTICAVAGLERPRLVARTLLLKFRVRLDAVRDSPLMANVDPRVVDEIGVFHDAVDWWNTFTDAEKTATMGFKKTIPPPSEPAPIESKTWPARAVPTRDLMANLGTIGLLRDHAESIASFYTANPTKIAAIRRATAATTNTRLFRELAPTESDVLAELFGVIYHLGNAASLCIETPTAPVFPLYAIMQLDLATLSEFSLFHVLSVLGRVDAIYPWHVACGLIAWMQLLAVDRHAASWLYPSGVTADHLVAISVWRDSRWELVKRAYDRITYDLASDTTTMAGSGESTAMVFLRTQAQKHPSSKRRLENPAAKRRPAASESPLPDSDDEPVAPEDEGDAAGSDDDDESSPMVMQRFHTPESNAGRTRAARALARLARDSMKV